jgi:phosphoribosyl 1,2-cyclic phosphodiesterase
MLGRELGPPVAGVARRFHVLLSHYHFDHLEGLPYFPPLYDPGSRFTFYGFDPEGSTIRRALDEFVRAPYFPVSFAGAPAEREYVRANREPFVLGSLRVSSLPLNHPDGSLAWCLDHGGRRIVYATDHEHGHPEIDAALERFSMDAELLVYDATYIPAEYESLRRGWGHSTWYAAVALARSARVKHLVLFHHHPDHTDDELERLLTFARAEFPATAIASEGSTFAF